MLKEMPGSSGYIVGIQATDTVTDSDYINVLIPRLETVIKHNGKARFLFNFAEDFHGYEVAAMWDDAIFGIKHSNDFEKCAVVGGPKWVDWGTKLAALIMHGQVMTFSANKLDDAWTWIRS